MKQIIYLCVGFCIGIIGPMIYILFPGGSTQSAGMRCQIMEDLRESIKKELWGDIIAEMETVSPDSAISVFILHGTVCELVFLEGMTIVGINKSVYYSLSDGSVNDGKFFDPISHKWVYLESGNDPIVFGVNHIGRARRMQS